MGRGVDRVAVRIAIGVVVIEIGFAGRVVGRVGVSGDAEERQQECGKASGNVQLNDRMGAMGRHVGVSLVLSIDRAQ